MGTISDFVNALRSNRGAALAGDEPLERGWSIVSGGVDSSLDTGPGMSTVPIWAAVRTVSTAVAGVPLKAHFADTGKPLTQSVPLLNEPFPGLTLADWVGQITTSLMLSGNAFGWVLDRDDSPFARPTQVFICDPAQVKMHTGSDGVHYTVGRTVVQRSDMMHIRWMVQPGGLLGMPPLIWHAKSLQLSHEVQKLKSDSAKALAPRGHLRAKAGAARTTNEIREQFKAMVSDGGLLVTDEGSEYRAIGLDPAALQFIEQAKLVASDWAAIFGIPPEYIGGDRGSSLTYSTTVSNQLEFQQRVVDPWLRKIEQALSNLIWPDGFGVIRGNLDAILRSTPTEKYQAILAQQQAGLLTVDEARKLMDKSPLTPSEYASHMEWLGKTKGVINGTPTQSSQD